MMTIQVDEIKIRKRCDYDYTSNKKQSKMLLLLKTKASLILRAKKKKPYKKSTHRETMPVQQGVPLLLPQESVECLSGG